MADPATRPDALTLEAMRARLAEARGPRLWKALDEVADTPTFRSWLETEAPSAARVIDTAVSRRGVLRAMAASFVMGGLTGCDVYEAEDLVPWVEQPEAMVPAVARFYASMIPFEGHARPVVVETHAARPTRLDGNDRHPGATLALDIFAQSEVLRLYDPDRSTTALRKGAPMETAAARAQVFNIMQALAPGEVSGQGARLLTRPVTSPTLKRQIAEWKERVPGLRWHVFDATGQVGQRQRAAEIAYGRPLDVRLRLSEADVVVSLEDDLLGPGLHQLDHAEGWAERRKRGHETGDLNRLFVAESTPTLTGAKAEERQRAASGLIPHLAAAIAAELGVPAAEPVLDRESQAWARRMAALLRENAGRALLTVGAHQPPEVQALALAANARIGAYGATLHAFEPLTGPADGDLTELVEEMRAGAVSTLVMLDVDPVYAAPGGLDFARALAQVSQSVHLGIYPSATARAADWHLPMAHCLETWGDGLATDGTAVIQQPMVKALYGGLHPHEVIEDWLGRSGRTALQAVRRTWRQEMGESDFQRRWEDALHDGWVHGTGAEPARLTQVSTPALTLDEPPAPGLLEAVFQPDPSVWDGRYANLGWLQELPKPITKLTWTNAVLVSPALAERLGLTDGQVVEVSAPDGTTVSIPCWTVPGQAAETVTLHYGQGRDAIGLLAEGTGVDVNPLRPAAGGGHRLAIVSLAPTDTVLKLPDTQMHDTMEARELIRHVSASETAKAGVQGERLKQEHPTLHGELFDYEKEGAEPYAWAMTIDLDTCIGCNACVTACVAENNILTVGPEEVQMGREMHWIRVDRYFEGDPEDPRIHFQPVPCMHCEHAPCEIGCPVRATVHGPEGLNQMIYNRCIGTRTCSSYCPYKVRRFNWFDYSEPRAPGLEAQFNPNVTVRSRGVMEKCTYCVQRISSARRAAKRDDRSLRDGEVMTACQTACPTQAIVFGDQNDKGSKVARLKDQPRNYELLGEVNTRPRTTYLAQVRPDNDTHGGDEEA